MINTLNRQFRLYRRRRRERRHARARIAVLEPLLPKNSVGAELGVFEGTFTRELVRHLQPAKLHLIDPWWRVAPDWHWAKGQPSTVDAVADLLKTWKQEIGARTIELHIDFSTNALSQFDDAYFDWVYLDSSHQYEATVQELSLLTKKMKSDGLIAGDDWWPDPTHRHHGVYRAVNELIASTDYELKFVDEKLAQWVIGRG